MISGLWSGIDQEVVKYATKSKTGFTKIPITVFSKPESREQQRQVSSHRA